LFKYGFVRLEPYEGKLSSTVLRGVRGGNVSFLLDIFAFVSKGDMLSSNFGPSWPEVDRNRIRRTALPAVKTVIKKTVGRRVNSHA